MKVLVTGSNGYIGTGVVKRLIDLGLEVIATDLRLGDIQSRCTFVLGDIFEIANPYDYYEHPDVIVHLAWRDGFSHNADSHFEDLPRHYAFLKRMIDSGIHKMIVLGSMHEIGYWEGMVSETTPCNPLSLYGIAKNALREALDVYTQDKDTVLQWLRGYCIVGNSEKGSSIFSKITAAVKNGEKNFPFTSGKNQYDFIDYEEFCNQICNVVINDGVKGIINCCSGKPESLASRVERFILEHKYDISLNYGDFPDRPYDSPALWGDNSKIIQIMKENGVL